MTISDSKRYKFEDAHINLHSYCQNREGLGTIICFEVLHVEGASDGSGSRTTKITLISIVLVISSTRAGDLPPLAECGRISKCFTPAAAHLEVLTNTSSKTR